MFFCVSKFSNFWYTKDGNCLYFLPNRYGLPVNFQAMLLHPHKKNTKRLRDVLNQLYGHLDSSAVQGSGIHDVRIGSNYTEYQSLPSGMVPSYFTFLPPVVCRSIPFPCIPWSVAVHLYKYFCCDWLVSMPFVNLGHTGLILVIDYPDRFCWFPPTP